MRAKLRAATRIAALALVEDYDYICNTILIAHVPDRGELRRLSVVLRRLLIYNEIRSIASSRIGRIQFLSPKFVLVDPSSIGETIFWQSGGRINNDMLCTIHVLETDKPYPTPDHVSRSYEEVSLAKFLDRPVLFFRGNWATRGSVVSYAANYTAAAHTTQPNDDRSIVLSEIERYIKFKVQRNSSGIGYGLSVDIIDHTFKNYNPALEVYDASINAIHLENMATASLFCDSPNVKELVEVIRAEIF